MTIPEEKELLDATIWDIAKHLAIEPKEVLERVREACDRSRGFYKWFIDDYEQAAKIPWAHADLQQKLDRLTRLNLTRETNG